MVVERALGDSRDPVTLVGLRTKCQQTVVHSLRSKSLTEI